MSVDGRIEVRNVAVDHEDFLVKKANRPWKMHFFLNAVG